ncbi:MAG: thioredoxin domain-containing protein, partial [Chloroflexota bacterium]
MRVARFSLLLVLLVMAACSPAPESPTPTPSPTLVPSSTPRPAVTENDYSGIPTGATDVGFPTLGESDAPVTLRMFGSYDSDATRRAHEEVFAPLLPRVRTGEVLVVYVPLSGTGTTANGAEAARAALCAGEQNVFWSYHSQLFARLATEGSDAFTGNALLDTADAVGLGREDYLACMESDRPDAVLSAATAAAADEPNYSGTPTLLANGNYMLNDYIAINRVVDQMLSRVDADGGVVGEATPIPTAENFELPPVAFQNVGTPIDIALPEGWEIVLNDSMIVQDIDAIRTIPFVLYKGPVQSGTGSIALLWGFPSLLAGNPFSAEAGATPVPNLLTDGLRLLRLAVVEPGCNIGTA